MPPRAHQSHSTLPLDIVIEQLCTHSNILLYLVGPFSMGGAYTRGEMVVFHAPHHNFALVHPIVGFEFWISMGGCLECVCVSGGGARCPVGHRASVCARVCASVRARARACSSTRNLKNISPPCLPGHTNCTVPFPWT